MQAKALKQTEIWESVREGFPDKAVPQLKFGEQIEGIQVKK